MKEFFENGYGVSVITDGIGHRRGLKELVVLEYAVDEDGFFVDNLCYSTHITNDFIGNLTDEEVEKFILEIKKLPSK